LSRNDSKRGVDRQARATKRELRQARCIHYAPPVFPLARRRNVNKRDAEPAFVREKAAAENETG